MHDLVVSVRLSPPRAVIRISGEIDLSATTQIRSAVEQVIEDRCNQVVVDLQGVTFIDCAGLHALTSMREHLEAAGGQLRFGQVSPAVTRLVTLTGSRDRWTIDGAH